MSAVVVSVRLFAMLREAARRERLEVELAEAATVADLLTAVGDEPGLGTYVTRLPLVTAVNREYVGPEHRLRPGDEVALIPPVSGGEDAEQAVHVRVTEAPLDVAGLAARVGRPGAGAVVTFSGTTREVARLDYEAYVEMAEARLQAILTQCVADHGLLAAAAEHRIGSVPLGQASVIVAVSAPHREEAFAGARAAIDRIKSEAPIWKREVTAGGEQRWVAGVPPPAARP